MCCGHLIAVVVDTSLIPLRSFASCGWMVTWLPCGGMPLVMPGRSTPSHLRSKQRKQTGKFSRQFLRLEKGYWGRYAEFFPLLGLLPTLLRLGTCYNNTPGAQFLHTLKSHYLQKVSNCLQTLTSCPSFVNFLKIVLVASQVCEYST